MRKADDDYESPSSNKKFDENIDTDLRKKEI